MSKACPERRRVLVTGGSGFIGGHVVERLAAQGHEVLSLDVNPPFLYVQPPEVKFCRCDVRDGYMVQKRIVEFGGIDAVIHLAGVLGTSWLLDREEYAVEHNINTTLPMLRIARDLDVKIVAPMVANSWLNPYTITKRAAGQFMKMFVQEYGARVTLVRETHVYGPRQAIDERQKIIPTLVGCALLGRPLPLFMQGEQRVDLVYAEDTAESLIRLALHRDALVGEEVEFATGRLVKVKDVARMIVEFAGSNSELLPVSRRPGQTGEDDPYSDLDRIFRECGEWAVTSLEEGLRKTVEWYREHLFLPRLHHLKRLVDADVFVLMDDHQFGPHWQRRTVIKTPQGVQYLTVPVRGGQRQHVLDVQVDDGQPCQKRVMRTLRHCYGGTSHFEPIASELEPLFFQHRRLYDLNRSLLLWLLKLINVRVEVVEQTRLGKFSARKTDLMVALTKAVDGDVYHCGKEAAERFYEMEKFEHAGIQVWPQDWPCPEYPQLWGAFVPSLSVIDALFNAGVEGTRRVLGVGERDAATRTVQAIT